MPSYHSTKELNFNAEDIYNIIIDVESYDTFLPWCHRSRILTIEDNTILAELVINYGGYYKYISEIKTNIRPNNNYEIITMGITGPFQYLKNSWYISPTPKGCIVVFDIEFELKNFFLNKLLGTIFKSIAQKMAASFEERAKEIINN